MAPPPGSPEWRRLVTASKAAAILGVSPWESPLSMWHLMKGTVEPEPQTTDQARGHLFEPLVLKWWLDQHPVSLRRRHKTQVTRWLRTWKPGWGCDWAFATLDALVTLIDATGRPYLAIVEVKTARDWDEWGEPGTDEIPAYYLAQALFQLACVPNAEVVVIPVLAGFFEFREYRVCRDDYAREIPLVVERCWEFWLSLASDEPPALDGHVATLETLRKLHPDIEPGLTVEVDSDLADQYATAMVEAKKAAESERLWKSRILDAAGRAQYVTDPDGNRIARRQANKSGVSLYCTVKG